MSAADVIRKRRALRLPAATVIAYAPRRVEVPVPPEFQEQEAALKQVQNLGQMDPPRPAVAAPVAPAVPASAAPMPVAAVDDEAEIEAAREADRESRFAAGMELAGRQLVGGITRTPVGQSLGANPSEVPLAMARAKSKREQAAEVLRARRQADEADAERKEKELDRQSRAAALLRAEREKEDARKESARRFEVSHGDSQALAQSNQDIARASLGLRMQGERRDAEKFEADKAEKAKGHQTSPSTLTDLADAHTAIEALTPLLQKFETLGMDSWLAKASAKGTDLLDLQETGAAEYKAAAQRAMQGVGKIFEGGKLAAGDETKYRQMLPRPGDSAKIARQKVLDSQDFLRSLVSNRIATLRKAGYNVPDVVAPAGGASKPSPGPGYVRGKVDGRPGWINQAKNDWEPD